MNEVRLRVSAMLSKGLTSMRCLSLVGHWAVTCMKLPFVEVQSAGTACSTCMWAPSLRRHADETVVGHYSRHSARARCWNGSEKTSHRGPGLSHQPHNCGHIQCFTAHAQHSCPEGSRAKVLRPTSFSSAATARHYPRILALGSHNL